MIKIKIAIKIYSKFNNNHLMTTMKDQHFRITMMKLIMV